MKSIFKRSVQGDRLTEEEHEFLEVGRAYAVIQEDLQETMSDAYLDREAALYMMLSEKASQLRSSIVVNEDTHKNIDTLISSNTTELVSNHRAINMVKTFYHIERGGLFENNNGDVVHRHYITNDLKCIIK